MKNYDMLDPNMLMIFGLLDHPVVLAIEKERIFAQKHTALVKALVEKCLKNETLREALDFDHDLAELFVATEVAERDHK